MFDGVQCGPAESGMLRMGAVTGESVEFDGVPGTALADVRAKLGM